jgi:hypothetical protein
VLISITSPSAFALGLPFLEKRSMTLLSTKRRLSSARLALLISTLVLPGCGGGGGDAVEGLVAVSGLVTYQGAPLTSGVVTFVPTSPDGEPASGNIGEDGRYVAVISATAEGMQPGDYKIRIESWASAPSMGEGGAVDPGTSAIPEKYGNAEASGLTATITPGEAQTVDLLLTE